MTSTATNIPTDEFHVTRCRELLRDFEELRKRHDGIALHPGITVYPVLWASPKDGSPPAPKEAFVHFSPGARYPIPDVHSDSAEIVEVLGDADLYADLYDERGAYPPGTRIYGKRGSSHRPGARDSPEHPEGCVVHVFFPDR